MYYIYIIIYIFIFIIQNTMVLRNTQIKYTKTKCTDHLKKHIIEITRGSVD